MNRTEDQSIFHGGKQKVLHQLKEPRDLQRESFELTKMNVAGDWN